MNLNYHFKATTMTKRFKTIVRGGKFISPSETGDFIETEAPFMLPESATIGDETYHDDIRDAARDVMTTSIYRNALEGVNELRVLPDYAFIDSVPNRYGPAPRRYHNLTPCAIRTTPKLSRNAPCPCGSGQKNKKCCGVAVMPGSE